MVNEAAFIHRVVTPAGVGQVPDKSGQAGTGGAFEEVLARERQVGDVKFSAHAVERLAQRKIALSSEELTRISQAADKAAGKGSRESLFLLKDLGLIVNVKNRTVLTALDPHRMQEGIVTNIDSTVIIPNG